jgi:serine/threonine protein kinase/Tol biopolymer transport system component
MPLSPGARLGPYEIVAPLGAGGMGEVYRATDTKLKRQVAVKILPPSLAADAERLARFQREAEVLASLNHPHIAAIYGLEDANGVKALVMELVEGEDLSQRIAGGAILLDEALPIAKQIAEALEAAHEQGIIHRDLKPANIKVRPEGTVKILDFGLAKLAESGEVGPASRTLTQSPTITSPAMMTGAGMILGTAAYMSPEQARGKTVDRRADIWAFGCVLYEMLTGKATFGGETLTDIVAAVVTNEPDWAVLPANTPAAARALLRRCLQKDPRRRLQHAGDARIEIEEAIAEPSPRSQSAHASRPTAPFARVIPWAIVALLALALLVTQIASRRAGSSSPQVVRLELNMPVGVEVASTNSPSLSISPDGTRVAFIGGLGGLRRLYVRRFDEFVAMPLRGTETVSSCFFSPDGSALAFVTSDRVLKKVSLADGLVTTVVVDADYAGGGGAWGPNDRITFGRGGTLWQVPATGGPARQLTTLDTGKNERLHGYPTVVTGGKAILFETVTGDNRIARNIEALSLTTGQRHRVVDAGNSPIYASSGHVIFFRDGVLLAAPFDADKLDVTGPAMAVLENVSLDQLGTPMVGLSSAGSLAYVASGNATKRLVWVSRQGVEQPITDISRPYLNPRLAPDAHRIVVEVAGGYLWIQDTARATFTRLTSGETVGNTFAVWTPDARRIVFRTLTGLRWIDPDGGGGSQAIPGTSVADIPSSISPDGHTLAFIRQTSESGGDIYALSLEGDPQPRAVVKTPGYDGGGQFSPDGRWMAYVSNESGQFEVYLRPYPGPDRKKQVSTQGGTHPKWNRNGKELFYRVGNKMMVVDVSPGPDLTLSQPRVLFEQRYAFGSAQTIPNYDVSPDGQRFVMVKDDSASGRLNIVLNWFEELKALVPTK